MAVALRLLVAGATAAAAANAPSDLVVVGAGPGGAYAAWRAAVSGLKVRVFERAQRPGGRIHSMRNQGPKGDLVVEAGAYRFAPHPVHEGQFIVDTPITAAIIKELGLPIAIYNPNSTMWDHGMYKIVGVDGNDAGYLTFVERMLELASDHGAEVRYGARVVALSSSVQGGEPLSVRLESGEEVAANAVVLNIPQHPLLELLRNSHGPGFDVFPRPLYVPVSYPIMKLYIHYDDAWWRNELGLVAGPFYNRLPEPVPQLEPWVLVPGQLPTPLQGQYHDGDVRCDGPGGRCRGFLQAFYGSDDATGGKITGSIEYYGLFHDSVTSDSAVELTHALPHHREILGLVHNALVDLHRPALDAINATGRVASTPPTGAVLSIWSQGVSGINAGCHRPKPGSNPFPEDLPKEALTPLPGLPIFVANEAYGHLNCWAESSLSMSVAAMKLLNVTQPDSLHAALLSQVPRSALPPTDPFLLQGRAFPQEAGRSEALAFAV